MRGTWPQHLLGACICLLWAGSVCASTIVGTVTNAEDGEPIPYTSVQLTGRTQGGHVVELGVLGSELGGFRLDSLPAGLYRIRFGHIGFAERFDTISLESGQELVLNRQLEPAPILMDELTVEGTRPEIEKKVQPAVVNLDAETLDAIPSVGEPDPIRSLQLLPGVQAASDISSGLYVRGGGPDQTLVLLDNITVYNPSHAFGFFSTFNSDVVGDVKLYKGAYPASHGGRLGSVLDIRTRETTAPSVVGTGAVSTIASRLTLEGPLGDHRWLVSGRRTYLDPIFSLLRRNNSEIPSYYFFDLNGKLDFNHSQAQTVLSGYTGRDDIFFDLDENTFVDIRWGNDIVSAAHRRIVSPTLSASAMLGTSAYSSATQVRLLATPFRVSNDLREIFVRSDLNWHPERRLQLVTGVQASSYDFRYKQSFNVVESIDFHRRPWELSMYADQQWDPNPGTSLRCGVRGRYLSDGERLLIEPRLSASRQVGDVRLKMGAGLYHQYLQLISTEAFSAGDFYFPIDETVPPGRSWQLVLGGEWEATRDYRLTAELYYTELDHLIVLDNRAPVDQASLKAIDLFHTDGDGYAAGLELFAERRTGALTGWIGYTLGTTRRKFEGLNGGEEFPPKYDRRHDVNVVANFRRGPWRYGVAFVYSTGQAFTPASARYNLRDPGTGALREGSLVLPGERNSARLLPYHRLDVSVNKRFKAWGRHAEWYVQVSNLYNRRNEWFVNYDPELAEADVVRMLPIIPSLGINFEF